MENKIPTIDTEVNKTVNVDDSAYKTHATVTPATDTGDTRLTSDVLDINYLTSFKIEIFKHIKETYAFRDTRSYSEANIKALAKNLLNRGVCIDTPSVDWLSTLVRFVEDKKQWLVYDNAKGIWRYESSDDQLTALVIDFFQALQVCADMAGDEIYKLYASTAMASYVQRTVNFLKTGRAFRINTAQSILDANERYRYFKTITNRRVLLDMHAPELKLREVRFKDTQQMMLQSISNIAISEEYDEDNPDEPKIWTDLLKQYMLNDPVKYEYFCKVLAYMMSPYNYNQVLIYWIGEGRNGKSTVIKVLQDILGPYACRLNSDLINAHPSPSFKKDDALAATEGKSLLIFNEIDERMVASTQNIKDLTEGGRDDYGNKILTTVRPAYSPNYNINICGTPVVIANTLINMGEWTNLKPIFKRLILIPFDYVIPKEDPDLLNKLAKEYPKIQTWLYVNYFKYKGVRLKDIPVPNDWQEVFDQYYADSDIIKAFWKECFEVTGDPKDKVLRSNIYKFYKNYCMVNGRKPIRNTGSNGFSQLISSVFKANHINPKPTKISGSEYIRGIKITQNYIDMTSFDNDADRRVPNSTESEEE